MNNIKYFEDITVPIPRKEIYARLGYAIGKTKISPAQEQKISKYIDKAAGLVNLKGAALKLRVKESSGRKIVLDGDIAFESTSLAQLLQRSGEVFLMAATAGKRIVDEIQDCSNGKDVTGAAIYDAVASEMADAALDWIEAYFNRGLRRQNKRLTSRRFSCGYGDLALSNQATMWNALALSKLGIKISKDFILTPEKSVTAIAGVEDGRGK